MLSFLYPFDLQEQVTLLEYGLNAVTEGIDAIATTRVLIRGNKSHTSTNAMTGETVHRTFRYILDICFFNDMFTSKFTAPKNSFCSSGTGAGMDIVVSSVRAYINALNKMLGFNDQTNPKVTAGSS